MTPLELHVYDFDGTLFRSPHKPDWWLRSWIVSESSLGMPCVPDVPGSEWWIGSTVARAKQSIADQDVYAILVTGRPAQAANFRFRVPELLKQAGLHFDEVHLNPGGDTPTFKANLVGKVLSKFKFTTVRMWDDEPRNFDTTSQMAERHGVEYVPTLIRSTPHEITCQVEDVVAAIADGWLTPDIIRQRLIKYDNASSKVADRWLGE